MTSRHRKDLLRMADSAANAQRRSARQLLALYNVYNPDYPDHADMVQTLGKSALELEKLILQFRTENM